MDGVSLLNFLDAPFVVGDPDGRIVYVNSAFARCFSGVEGDVVGTEMASVFSGWISSSRARVRLRSSSSLMFC